ncbi:hypothetical protein C6V80_04065 [Caminibacter pacificus]|uniref:Regulatory protein YrvL n=1 Tax=Caminibacter pacificus TaxID=1424653 RepID=A0ABX5TJD3_9BACT|nr:hypothetical protein [Caminibacter pacificus]QCI28159.2 hypothetical protein C6V80_04065 [Caminibacter pacificus]
MDEFLKNVNGIEKYSILFMFFIYLFGFVIVNAFLGKYSVYEVNAISTLNIIAGLLFLVFLLEYYFLVWNNLVICIKKYVLWYCSIEMFFLLTLNTFILNNIFFSVHDNLIEYIFFSGFVFFFILELLKIYNKLILALN